MGFRIVMCVTLPQAQNAGASHAVLADHGAPQATIEFNEHKMVSFARRKNMLRLIAAGPGGSSGTTCDNGFSSTFLS